ncbi:unnamed protein product [Urochloa humidicola]
MSPSLVLPAEGSNPLACAVVLCQSGGVEGSGRCCVSGHVACNYGNVAAGFSCALQRSTLASSVLLSSQSYRPRE